MTTYAKRPHSVLESNAYKLSAPTLSNGKWNPQLSIRAQAKVYKGYISDSYFEVIARTGIENDKNNGNVIAELDPQAMHAFLNAVEGYANGTITEERTVFNNYDFAFGRDKKRSETQKLKSRVMVGLKEGIITIAVIDAMDDTRPKISFPLGFDAKMRGRYSLLLSTGGKEDRAVSSRNAAAAYVSSVRSVLEDEMYKAQMRAISKAGEGDGESNNDNGSRYTESTDSTSDDDLPF